jgi:hypothetical protein
VLQTLKHRQVECAMTKPELVRAIGIVADVLGMLS